MASSEWGREPGALPHSLFATPYSLLLLRRGLLGRWRAVAVAGFVEADIDHIGLKLRGARHREAQVLLDVREHDIGRARPERHRDPPELGDDGLGLDALAHDGVAQRNVDLVRRTRRSHDHSPLHADPHPDLRALERALASKLCDRELIAQVTGGRLLRLR